MADKKRLTPHQFSLCVPLAPKTAEEARGLSEQAQAAAPDFVEWRRDAMSLDEDAASVLLALKLSLCETTGIIYTYRAFEEGGVSDVAGAARQEAVIDAITSDQFDYVDTEYHQDGDFLARVFDAAQTNDTGIILSYHVFEDAIAPEALAEKLAAMAAQPADAVKVAVTGLSPDAVGVYGAVVSHFAATCDKPVIYTLMGAYGTVVRALPEAFGGTLTFAAIDDAHATAPGQLTPRQIAALREQLHFA